MVTRLARSGPAGGAVVERAAILAEGADSGAIITWIIAHAGQPEAIAARRAPFCLDAIAQPRAVKTPRRRLRRYVLPAGALT